MKNFLLSVLLASGFHCIAQEGEFTDFRTKRESFSRIYDKTIRSELASFALGGIEESLNKAPLRKISATRYGSDFISFDTSTTTISIHSGRFIAGRHKLAYEGKFLTRIDNKAFYGNYGKVPTTGISAVTVVIGKDSVAIPPGAFADLYNPQFTFSDATGTLSTQTAVYLSPDNHRIYIYMLNKDNFGSYEVTWIIQDKTYLRRVIDYGFAQ